MRRPAATALIALAALATAACGSSSKQAAPTEPTVPATTAPTTRARPTTVHATTTAATTTAAPPPPATTAPTTATATTVTAAPSAIAQTLCPSEQQPGIAANFGHRRSKTSAEMLLAQAGKVGFTGLSVQRRGCSDYAVVLVGLKNLREARSLRTEAAHVGFPVRIECRSHPVQGGIAAVFGHRRTRRAAVRLRRKALGFGFRNLQVQQDRCNDWEVDLYGITTSAQRRDLAREAASVGFHLTFERG